jgi:hypothetical protein
MKTDAQLLGVLVFERARVRLLFRDANFWQDTQELARFHFELPSQFIYADLAHTSHAP